MDLELIAFPLFFPTGTFGVFGFGESEDGFVWLAQKLDIQWLRDRWISPTDPIITSNALDLLDKMLKCIGLAPIKSEPVLIIEAFQSSFVKISSHVLFLLVVRMKCIYLGTLKGSSQLPCLAASSRVGSAGSPSSRPSSTSSRTTTERAEGGWWRRGPRRTQCRPSGWRWRRSRWWRSDPSHSSFQRASSPPGSAQCCCCSATPSPPPPQSSRAQICPILDSGCLCLEDKSGTCFVLFLTQNLCFPSSDSKSAWWCLSL